MVGEPQNREVMNSKERLRCLLVTQNDPFFVLAFIRKFFARYEEDRNWMEICGMIVQKPLGKKSFGRLVRQMWEFFGPVDFIHMGISYATRRAVGLTLVTLGVDQPILTMEQ